MAAGIYPADGFTNHPGATMPIALCVDRRAEREAVQMWPGSADTGTMRVGVRRKLGRVVVAVSVALVGAVACGTAPAAVVPGTNVVRDGQLAGGKFVVWRNSSVPWITCSDEVRIPAPQTVLDLRSLRTYDLPASVDGGSVEVTHMDPGGGAIGKRHLCNDTIAYGRVDLATGAFVDYTTLPEAQPLPELHPACPGYDENGYGCGPNGSPAIYGFHFDTFVRGEALEIEPMGSPTDPWNAPRYLVRRVDMVTGRTRTRTFGSSVVIDGNQVPFARAANGDLVWLSTDDRPAKGAEATHQYPCRGRVLVRRWSYETGAFSSTRATRGGLLPDRAVARSVTTCSGELDPDTGLLHNATPQGDHVTWQLVCGPFNGLRIRACGPANNSETGERQRCCLRVHDALTNQVRMLPARRTGPSQSSVLLTPELLVWQSVIKTGSGERRAQGPLQYERLSRLRPAVKVTKVSRRGSRLTIAWRTFGTHYRTNLVEQIGLYAWDDPKFAYFSGLRRLGSPECRGPYGFPRAGPPAGYDRCSRRLRKRADTVTFIDPPGRQRYFVNAGGFMSQPIVG